MVEQLQEDYPDRLAALTMHVNDDGYDTPWGQSRLDDFYGLAGTVPIFMVDALWNCQSQDYRYYVEQQLAQPTDTTLELSGIPVGGSTWDVTVRVCLEGGGSRQIRVVTAAALDDYPNPPRHSTNVLRQDAFETDVTVPGGGCQSVTTRITFDSASMASTDNIVIIAWAQARSVTAPTDVYQAGIMRWPFPAGSQLTTIEVEPDDVTMAVGESIEFTATGRDQSGEVYPLTNPVWSLGTGSGGGTFDPGAGSATTTFTATSVGTRIIECSDGGVTGGALVTIREAPELTTIEIEPASTTVAVGGQSVFTATGKDQYGDDFPLSGPTWSIAGDGDGDFDPATGTETTFTASYPGSALITCTEGAIAATAEITITGEDPALAAITVDPSSAAIRVGDELELTATGSDQYGRAFALADPAWRVEGTGGGELDPSSGSATTTFTATTAGSAQVICTADGVDGAVSLEISPAGLPAPRRATRRVTP